MLNHRDERGSVALVVMVIFVMASLAAIMVSRNAADLRLSVTEQQQAAADAAADLGISRVLARIQNGESAPGLVDEGSAGDASWSVTARALDGSTWDVVSTGSLGTTLRSFGATVVQRGDQFWVISNWRQLSAGQQSQTLMQEQQKRLPRQKRSKQMQRRNLFQPGLEQQVSDLDPQELLQLLR